MSDVHERGEPHLSREEVRRSGDRRGAGLADHDARWESSWPCMVALSWLLLSGCMADHGHVRDIRHPVHASPARDAGPAAGKWEGPWMSYSVGSALRATFYYGPWQCNERWMTSCRRECAEQGLQLMGCMWLADIKYDWQAPVMPVKAGSRYALWHCCCSYGVLSKPDKDALRKQWVRSRDSIRREWSRIYGDWPSTGGTKWPGHHMRDLHHGGNPVDLGNIFPTPPDVHDVFNLEYPTCYQGSPPWNTVGPDLPYRD
jgi:hypothetical protein